VTSRNRNDPSDLMVYAPPYLAGLLLLESAKTHDWSIRSVLDLTALAVLLAGVFVVARYRAALAAADISARAWHEERDAALSRAERLAAELVDVRSENAALKLRPDLDSVTELLRNHEMNADRRADRIIAALHETRT